MLGRVNKQRLKSSREFIEHREDYIDALKKIKYTNIGYVSNCSDGLVYLCMRTNPDAVQFDYRPSFKYSNNEIRIPILYGVDCVNDVTCVTADITNKNHWRCIIRFGDPKTNNYVDAYECEQIPTNLHGIKFNVKLLLSCLNFSGLSCTMVIIPPENNYNKSSFSITQSCSFISGTIRKTLEQEFYTCVDLLPDRR